MVSSVGFEDCDAMAMIGHNRLLSTALPNNNNFPHIHWMNFLPLLSSSGSEECFVSYFVMAT